MRSSEISVWILQLGLWGAWLFYGSVAAEASCPTHRVFDPNQANAKQYGAPDGCVCVNGMRGLDCAMCKTDEGCQQTNSSDVCRTGMVYSASDSYKAYSCRLTDTLESFFTNGKVDVFVNLTTRSAKMVVYNGKSINDGHAVDCFLSGCTFKPGDRSGDCANVDCYCTDQCSDLAKPIIEKSLSQKPAKFVVEDDSMIDVQIQGSLFDIKAYCNASACTPDANVTLTEKLGQERTDWGPTATFALTVLGVIFGTFAILAACASLLLTSDQPSKKNSTEDNASAMDAIENVTPSKDILEFNHISMFVDLPPSAARIFGREKKYILKNLSGSVESGCVMGIMGQSGSGKSSLLNTLAAVDNRGAKVSGQILVNGKAQMRGYRNVVAYVQQADTLYETLSVRECIEYSAMLRLSRRLSKREKLEQVEKTIQELHLEKVSNSRIESISGGERRRVSIGMELVNEAKLLICDEPTSGLDSSAANSIMTILSELASRGRIIILSIHQPSVKSFLMMDQIMLLAEGRIMYNGRSSEAAQYFEGKGFSCPVNESISDYMLDVISDRANHDILAGLEIHQYDYDKILETIEGAEDATESSFTEVNGCEPVEPRSITNEFAILFARAFKDILRNRTLFIMQLTLSVALALFAGGIFKGVPNNLAGFQNRMGAFYFALSFFGFASFSSMDMFVRERDIFIREVGSKYYRAYPYFLAKVTLDAMMLRVIPATVFSFLFYWLMSLKDAYESFLIFWATLVLFNICAGAISICVSIATPTVGQANLLAAVWFLVMLLFGGFLVNVQTMSAGFSWLKYVSIFYYSFEILMTNELSGLLLSFDAPGYPSIPIYGEVFLKTIGMDADNQIRDLTCMCMIACGFSLLAYILLLVRAPRSAKNHFKKMKRNTHHLALTHNNSEYSEDCELDDE